MPEIVRGGPFGVFENQLRCKISEKIRGTLWIHYKSVKNDKFESLSAENVEG